MSLQLAAQHLAAKGRGPDTQLIHMAPGEVAGLQSLAKAAGGSLTINPDTGLPEAGILSDLLPTILGFGASALSGGAIPPWMIGAGIGGLKAMQSGDLGQGVMAGLGAYGGAGLGEGIMGLGTGAMQQQVGAAASQGLEGVAADQAAQQAIAERMAQATPMDRLSSGMRYAMDKPMDAVKGMGGMSAVGKNVLAAAAPALGGMAPTTDMPKSSRSPALFRKMRMNPDGTFTEIGSVPMSEYGSTPFERYAEGGDIRTVTPMPGQTPSERAMDYLMGRTTSLKPEADLGVVKPPVVEEKKKEEAVLPMVRPVYESPGDGGGVIGGTTAPSGGLQGFMNTTAGLPVAYALGKISDYFSTPKTAEEIAATPVVDLQGTPTQAAIDYGKTSWGKTGDVEQDIGGALTGVDTVGSVGQSADFGEKGDILAHGGMVGHYAAGGLGSLGSYSDGGRLLRGPGDGVSDSIPATIGKGNQPARLADGEFVVPARIVSELGNGSTEAGARKLYQMMARIQKNRGKTTGKSSVAVNSRSDRHLPA